MRKKDGLLAYLTRNLRTVAAIVLIWRGIWHLLDLVDEHLLGGHIWITAAGGIVLGVLLLYLPDRDLKELEKL